MEIADVLLQMPETCVLDLIGEEGKPMTLEAIGAVLGVTRERVRQIEQGAKAKFLAAIAENIHEWDND